MKNGEKTLERSLKSVVNQTYRDFEIITVLNNCTDNSENICKKFKVKEAVAVSSGQAASAFAIQNLCKAGDNIVRINVEQVQGKTLMEAVNLMRGPVGSSIEITIRRKGLKKANQINKIHI